MPPGCYPSAVEILRRQYLAHLLDLAAAGRWSAVTASCCGRCRTKAPRLFGPSGYLIDLVEVAISQGEKLAKGFLALFPTGVSDQARKDPPRDTRRTACAA